MLTCAASGPRPDVARTMALVTPSDMLPGMSRPVLVAWIVAAVAAVAAIVDIVVRPMHWERTLAAALVIALVAAAVAVAQSRRVPTP